AFVVVFSLMAGFVVGVTVVAAKTGAPPVVGGNTPAGGGAVPAGAGHAGGGPCGGGDPRGGPARGGPGRGRRPAPGHPASGHTGTVVIRSDSATHSAQLAASLRAAIGSHLGRLSVAVIDTTSGAEAWYHASKHYDTASIVKMDILAALLYLHQRA